MSSEQLKLEITRVRMLLGEPWQSMITDVEISIVLAHHYPRRAAEIIMEQLKGPK